VVKKGAGSEGWKKEEGRWGEEIEVCGVRVNEIIVWGNK
jgi:hypothetical protein